MSREDLAAVLAQVSHELAGERDETLTATRICELAVEVVDGCHHATLVVRGRRGRLVLAAATSETARRLEEQQLVEVGAFGPTIDALESADPVVSHDLAPPLRDGGLEPRERGHRCAGTVERPVEPAERDGRDPDRGLDEHDDLRGGDGTVGGALGEEPEEAEVGHGDDEQAQRHRALAQAGRLELQVVQPSPGGDEAVRREQTRRQ